MKEWNRAASCMTAEIQCPFLRCLYGLRWPKSMIPLVQERLGDLWARFSAKAQLCAGVYSAAWPQMSPSRVMTTRFVAPQAVRATQSLLSRHKRCWETSVNSCQIPSHGSSRSICPTRLSINCMTQSEHIACRSVATQRSGPGTICTRTAANAMARFSGRWQLIWPFSVI